MKKSVKNIIFTFFKSNLLIFLKRGIFDIFTLNALNITGTFDVTLHNLMLFCHKPKLTLVDKPIESSIYETPLELEYIF